MSGVVRFGPGRLLFDDAAWSATVDSALGLAGASLPKIARVVEWAAAEQLEASLCGAASYDLVFHLDLLTILYVAEARIAAQARAGDLPCKKRG